MLTFEEHLESVVADCQNRWGRDNRTENLHEKVKVWLQPIADSETKGILLTLLLKFNYYTRESEYRYLRSQLLEIMSEVEIQKFSIITAIKSEDGKVNSSHDYIFSMKHFGFVDEALLIDDISSVVDKEEWEYIKYIIIADDICGTGETVITYLSRFGNKLSGKKIIYIVTEIATDAYERLRKHGYDNGYTVEIKYNNMYRKAFDEGNIFSRETLDRCRDIIRALERKVCSRDTKNIMGRYDSQALVAFSANTPNNTLSCFWKENKRIDWSPLFPRKRRAIPEWRSYANKKRNCANMSYNLAAKMKNHVR